MDDSLRKARRAAAVNDVEVVAGGDLYPRRILFAGCFCQRVVILIAADVFASGEDIPVGGDGRQVGSDSIQSFCGITIRNNCRGLRIPQKCGKGFVPQQRAERHDHRPDLGYSPVRLDQLQTIWKNGGDLITFANPQVEERVRQTIDAAVEF